MSEYTSGLGREEVGLASCGELSFGKVAGSKEQGVGSRE